MYFRNNWYGNNTNVRDTILEWLDGWYPSFMITLAFHRPTDLTEIERAIDQLFKLTDQKISRNSTFKKGKRRTTGIVFLEGYHTQNPHVHGPVILRLDPKRWFPKAKEIWGKICPLGGLSIDPCTVQFQKYILKEQWKDQTLESFIEIWPR